MTTITNKPSIFWLTPDRFDLKLDKSSWLEMVTGLAEKGYQVHIITGYGEKKYISKAEAIDVISLSAIDKPLIFRFSLLLNTVFTLLKIARKEDIFIINPDSLFIVPILKFFGLNNFLLDIRTLPVKNKNFKDRVDNFIFWKASLNLLSRLVTGYSFITKSLKKSVEEEFNTKFEDYVIWSSGVNTKLFKPINKEKKSTKFAKFTLFYHGSIFYERGIHRIVEAMAILDKSIQEILHFVVVGSGPGDIFLKALVMETGLNKHVDFLGFMPYEAMPSMIAEADLCICPLPSRPEWNVSSPLKVLEYMACGKPMILTPIPAHKEAVGEEDFVVWTSGFSAYDFKNAIEFSIYNFDKLSDAAGKAPHIIKERYEWNVQSRNLADYLQKKFV